MGLKNSIAQNLRKPSSGFVGRMISKKVFKQKNVFLEQNAVRLCRLESHHHVLEVGFGPGIGLKAAADSLVDGKVYGIDYSQEMVQEAQRSLKTEIATGKLLVELGDVTSQNLPYPDTTMDRIFHCNCYYFWPDARKVAEELYRVLKLGGFMVTVLNRSEVEKAAKVGFLRGASWEPEPYMEALLSAGFTDVTMEDMVHTQAEKEITYQAILAHKN